MNPSRIEIMGSSGFGNKENLLKMEIESFTVP